MRYDVRLSMNITPLADDEDQFAVRYAGNSLFFNREFKITGNNWADIGARLDALYAVIADAVESGHDNA